MCIRDRYTTSCIYNRLIEWSSANTIICDVQFRFQPNFSTVDAFFRYVKSLITNYTQSRKNYNVILLILKKLLILSLEAICG